MSKKAGRRLNDELKARVPVEALRSEAKVSWSAAPVRLEVCAARIRCPERNDTRTAAAITKPVQFVAPPARSVSVSSNMRSTHAGGNGGR
jgi:hypothetical protein